MALYGTFVISIVFSDKSYEFFYQLGLSEFGNFGRIELAERLNLQDLLALSMETDDDSLTQQTQTEELEVGHILSNTNADHFKHFNSTT